MQLLTLTIVVFASLALSAPAVINNSQVTPHPTSMTSAAKPKPKPTAPEINKWVAEIIPQFNGLHTATGTPASAPVI
jgi:hypothetical protein